MRKFVVVYTQGGRKSGASVASASSGEARRISWIRRDRLEAYVLAVNGRRSVLVGLPRRCSIGIDWRVGALEGRSSVDKVGVVWQQHRSPSIGRTCFDLNFSCFYIPRHLLYLFSCGHNRTGILMLSILMTLIRWFHRYWNRGHDEMEQPEFIAVRVIAICEIL